MSDILSGIAAYKREEVRLRRAATSRDAIERRAAAAGPPRDFRAALERARAPGRPALIAEIKKASPSRGVIRADFDAASLARAYADGGAACLSVLTDRPSFQGDDVDLVAARGACGVPCLRKEFMIDSWQVHETRALGADAILVILALVDDVLAAELLAEATALGMDALVETHDASEVRRAARLGANLIGVNNRDLKTFVTDLAVTEALAQEIPASALLVTESGIFTRADAARMAAAGAAAMLVGEALMREADVAAATARLTGQGEGQVRA